MGFLTIAGGFARGAQGALEADRAQEANIELENIRQKGTYGACFTNNKSYKQIENSCKHDKKVSLPN